MCKFSIEKHKNIFGTVKKIQIFNVIKMSFLSISIDVLKHHVKINFMWSLASLLKWMVLKWCAQVTPDSGYISKGVSDEMSILIGRTQ